MIYMENIKIKNWTLEKRRVIRRKNTTTAQQHTATTLYSNSTTACHGIQQHYTATALYSNSIIQQQHTTNSNSIPQTATNSSMQQTNGNKRCTTTAYSNTIQQQQHTATLCNGQQYMQKDIKNIRKTKGKGKKTKRI
ncbi:hypothetical protein ACTA71_000293 [Dictyostelium dimigraforme]